MNNFVENLILHWDSVVSIVVPIILWILGVCSAIRSLRQDVRIFQSSQPDISRLQREMPRRTSY